MQINRVVTFCCLATIATATDAADGDNIAELDEITVVSTASGFEQNIADAPASITVISREELDKKSYINVYDAVKNIPGVFVTGGGGQQDISIRGMSASYTLYMIDGRPINQGRQANSNGTDGGKQIALPPLAMIERIEVIRGPMSSLYGSDAMGGVINFITRKNKAEWHGTIGAEYNHALNNISSDSQKVEVYAGGAIVPGLLSLQVNGSWIGTDESDYQGGEKASESTPESTNKKGGVKLILTPNDSNEIAVAYDTATRRFSHTSGKSVPETVADSTSRFDKDIYTLTHNGSYGNWRTRSYLQHDISDNAYSTQNGQTKREKTTIFNPEATWFSDIVSLTVGGRYTMEQFVDETNGLYTSNISGAVRKVDRWIGAAFTEAEWYLGDKTSLTTGLRYDVDELFGSHFSPRGYLVHHRTKSLTLKGGVSTGYKQPSLTSATPGFGRGTGGAGSPAPHPRALIIGNKDLDPETSINYEIGFVYDKVDWGLNVSAMAFYTQFKNRISEDRYCDPGGDRNDPSTWGCAFGGNNYLFLSTQKNIDKAEMKGVEFSFSKHFLKNLHVNGSYTYTASEQKSGDFKGKPLNRQPKHMINVGLDWDMADYFGAWTRYNYRGKTSDYLSRTAMSNGTPAYGFWDIGLNYKLKKYVTAKAGVYNVTNKRVTNGDYEVVLAGRYVNFGLTVDF